MILLVVVLLLGFSVSGSSFSPSEIRKVSCGYHYCDNEKKRKNARCLASRSATVMTPEVADVIDSLRNDFSAETRRLLYCTNSSNNDDKDGADGLSLSKTSNVIWMKRLLELRDFRQKHGHCNVPLGYPENPQLGTWIRNQRHQYSKLQRGEKSNLSNLRLRMTQDIGVDWNLPETLHDSSNSSSNRTTFPQRSIELFATASTATVRNASDQEDANVTLMMQQDQLQEQQEEEKFPGNILDRNWYQRYQELLMFREEYGHCDVPKKYHQNPQLGTWVSTQRQQYKLVREGTPEKGKGLTEERQSLLERIGFRWKVHRQYSQSQTKPIPLSKGYLSLRNVVSNSTVELLKARNHTFGMLDLKWIHRLGELKDFRDQHGHCHVPTRFQGNPPLGAWVKEQKKQYKKMRAGEKTFMTEERMLMLEDVGIQWTGENDTRSAASVVASSSLPERSNDDDEGIRDTVVSNEILARLRRGGNVVMATKQEQRWVDRFLELCEFKEAHGHCYVPRRYEENTRLSNWVAAQRTWHRRRLEQLSPSSETPPRLLTDELKEHILEEIGFDWVVPATAHQRSVHVKQREPPSDLVDRLREILSDKAFEALFEENDYVFNKFGTKWMERLIQLTEFRDFHGHCNVPKRYKPNIQLGNWVATQRNQYRKFMSGDAPVNCIMTELRRDLLEDIGFLWQPPGRSSFATPNNDQANEVLEQLGGVLSDTTMELLQRREFSRNDLKWIGRFLELHAFKLKHGHCNVPRKRSADASLASWVYNQKRQHGAEQKSSTALIRIQMLRELGLDM